VGGSVVFFSKFDISELNALIVLTNHLDADGAVRLQCVEYSQIWQIMCAVQVTQSQLLWCFMRKSLHGQDGWQ
jgi:hypothetical protein